jgi:hypothetical protein
MTPQIFVSQHFYMGIKKKVGADLKSLEKSY